MNIKDKLKKTLYAISITPDYIFLIAAFVLILPFLILSCYDNPSIDDYSFAFNTRSLGFWGTQSMNYMTWMGRYFSTFILSAVTMVFGIYKFFPVLLIALIIHALYRLVSIIFPASNYTYKLLFAIILSFFIINGMPTLSQGIYWLSASITYYLANILTLHLTLNIINIISADYSSCSKRKYLNFFLILAASGSNETSMVIINVLLFCLSIYDAYLNKKIRKEFIYYLIFSAICSTVVIIAPGNIYRATDFTSPSKHQLLFTLFSSIEATGDFVLKWLCDKQTFLLFIFCLTYCIVAPPKPSLLFKSKFTFILILALVVILLVSSFFVGFWSIGFLPPYRTINITHFIFMCSLTVVVVLILNLIQSLLKKMYFTWTRPLLLICTFICIYFIDLKGNYAIAVNDILSGKAYIYNNECFERQKAMKECTDTICTIPSFSVFPVSIFNKDVSFTVKTYWNDTYARYYGKKRVSLAYREPLYSDHYFFNFDNPNDKLLEGLQTISNAFAFTPPNSSCISETNPYSASFNVDIKKIGNGTIKGILTTASINVLLSSPDSIINAKIVFCISDSKTGETILWEGKDINIINPRKNKWIKENQIIHIAPEHRSSENKISIYVWNTGKSKIFVDNLDIKFY